MKRDGCWGWLVVAAALLCQTILGGICLSGGLFYIIFRSAFNTSPVETSWLCSMPMTLWFTGTPLGSVVINRFGYRACAFLGGLTASLGLCLSYFAPNAGFLFFSHGILTGLGFGMNYVGCMTAVSDYFDKYRTIATGIITIGHNLGLVIFSVFILYLDSTFGWRGAMLLLGGITLNLCMCALLMQPVEKTPRDMSEDTKPIINTSVLRKKSFLCFCLSNVLVNTSTGIYLLHLPSYAREIGLAGQDFALVMTVYGITNVFGKVVYSIAGHHQSVDITLLYTASLAATGICIGLFPVLLSRAGMFTLSGLSGFFYCATGALLAAVIFRIVGHDRFADGAGMSLPFKATGNLIGGPVAGFLFDTTGDYSSSFYLGGATIMLSAVVMIYPIVYHRRQERQHKKPNLYLVAEGEITPGDYVTKEALLSDEKLKI